MEKLCRIRELQRAVNRFEAALERSYGICLNEGMALCSLSKAGRLSCGELGEMLGLTPSNTSKVLRSVEGKGYVNRELGTNDKRQMYFSLTEAGRAERPEGWNRDSFHLFCLLFTEQRSGAIL